LAQELVPVASLATTDAKPSITKPKDMEDSECACKPKLPTEKEKIKIKAKNDANVKKAAEATAKATADRKKAEDAIKSAVIIKKQSDQTTKDITKKAQDMARKAARSDVAAAKSASKASVKVVAKGKGKTEQDVKVKTKNWEETVVQKHEVWKSYTNIRKNVKISTANLKLVNQNLKKAETKITSIVKAAALNPKDVSIKQKLEEAKRIAEVIRKQKADAESQRLKME
jgi:hypothetical protein